MDWILDVSGLRLPPVADACRMILALVFAAMFGGFIGLDRQQRGRAAGLRTHAMVAVGAALFTLVAVHSSNPDASRVGEIVKGIAAGIGFLGSGAILKNDDRVVGLTTASTIWLTAAVGLAAGAGMVWLAAITTALSLLMLKSFSSGDARRDDTGE